MPLKLKSLTSTWPSPFPSGLSASPLLKSGSSTSFLNTRAKSSASPIVTFVNGIRVCCRPCDCAIAAKRFPTSPSMATISFGPALLKLFRMLTVVDPGVALNVTAIPELPLGEPKMLTPPGGDVIVSVAVARLTSWPVLFVTSMPAPMLAVRLTLKTCVSVTDTSWLADALVMSARVMRASAFESFSFRVSEPL
jgi:hypothetical protein